MPLGFLAPWFLLGALVAAVPVVLHLFRRETATVQRFSVVRFVRRTPVEQTRHRRLGDLLLLLLRVAAVLFLAVAFARPFLQAAPRGATADTVTVVAVDTSDSLSAPGAWADARRLAHEAVRNAPPGPVGVVTFDDEGRMVAEPVANRTVVHAAIDALRPGAGSTRLAAAVRTAEPLFGGAGGRLVVVSDLQRYTIDEVPPIPAPPGVTVVVQPVKPMGGNVAIAALDREDERLVAVVANHGSQAWRGELRAEVDGRVFGTPVSVEVPASATAQAIVAGPLPREGVVAAGIADPDGAQGDNRRWLVLDPLPAVPVAVITGPDAARETATYVGGALEAATRQDGTPAFDVRRLPATSRELADRAWWRRHGAAVLLATRGFDRAVRESLAASITSGLGVLIVAGPDVEAAVVRELTRGGVTLADAGSERWPAELVPVDLRHPVLAALGTFGGRLAQVQVDRGVRVEGRSLEILVKYTNGLAALVEYRDGAAPVLVFGSDLGRRWGAFPLHPTFAPFVFEAVRHLAGRRDERRELTVADLPSGSPRAVGVVSLGEPARRVAVNVDRREAVLEFAAAGEVAAAVLPSGPASADLATRVTRESEQRLWRWVAALVFALLVAESLVAAGRRPVGVAT